MSTSFALEGFKVRIAGLTDVGRKRSHNEDYLFLPDDESFLIVADGMGGHARGDLASQLAVETAVNFFRKTTHDRHVTWPFSFDHGDRRQENRLVTAVKLANKVVFEASRSEQNAHGMGTTFVGVLFFEERLVIGHVGDSRGYRVRGGKIAQLTEDHSLLNDYIKMKRLRPEDADNFPNKNVIVRALGMYDDVSVDLIRDDPAVGDVYLFCTDGLNGMLEDGHILECVNSEHDLDRCCQLLIDRANDAGGVDNITVAMARIEPP